MDYLPDEALWLAWAVPAVASAAAAVVDVRQFRVPNGLTLPLCGGGLLFHTLLGGVAGLERSGGGLVVGGLLLILFFLIGAMGAGDVKLLAGVGAWLGPSSTISVFLVAGLAAGMYSLGVYALRHRLRELRTVFKIVCLQLVALSRHVAPAEVGVRLQRADRRWHVMPFALMIAIGVLLVGLRV
jgi:prepilin peptidase CpaA